MKKKKKNIITLYNLYNENTKLTSILQFIFSEFEANLSITE